MNNGLAGATAIYVEPVNCNPCIDLYPNEVGTLCGKCIKARTHKVKVLSTSPSIFGGKAIISFNGKFIQVPISCLKENTIDFSEDIQEDNHE
jgi:hypothetical protein